MCPRRTGLASSNVLVPPSPGTVTSPAGPKAACRPVFPGSWVLSEVSGPQSMDLTLVHPGIRAQRDGPPAEDDPPPQGAGQAPRSHMTCKGVSPKGAGDPCPTLATTPPPITPRFTGCHPHSSGNPRLREGKAPRLEQSQTPPSAVGLWLPLGQQKRK